MIACDSALGVPLLAAGVGEAGPRAAAAGVVGTTPAAAARGVVAGEAPAEVGEPAATVGAVLVDVEVALLELEHEVRRRTSNRADAAAQKRAVTDARPLEFRADVRPTTLPPLPHPAHARNACPGVATRPTISLRGRKARCHFLGRRLVVLGGVVCRWPRPGGTLSR
jgi:hypothetical protein